MRVLPLVAEVAFERRHVRDVVAKRADTLRVRTGEVHVGRVPR
jgi:hypothetical protein